MMIVPCVPWAMKIREPESVSTVLQAAYVLHYTPFRDPSFIVDFFTLEQGRIGLVARGARSAKSRTRALYQPFRPVLVTWVAGKGDLHTLTGIEESGQALDMSNTALACGYYINELILRLVGKSGLLPDFTRLVDGNEVDPDAMYRYFPENALTLPESGTKTPDTHPDGVTPDKGIRVSGSTLHGLAQLDFSGSETLTEAKPIMRHVLRTHLGDRPLRSREMFDALVRPDRHLET